MYELAMVKEPGFYIGSTDQGCFATETFNCASVFDLVLQEIFLQCLHVLEASLK